MRDLQTTLSVVPPGARRLEFLPLLLLADESEQQVRAYLQQGELFVFSALEPETTLGIVLSLPLGPASAELKAVAVSPAWQRRGLGSRMLAAVLAELRQRGVHHVSVGTASSGTGELAFYQRAGFRLARIERDFFSPERGYPALMTENGIRVRDMVWLEQSLEG
jgi:ribosomal protein S18 acetylase RimI-like enzyme